VTNLPSPALSDKSIADVARLVEECTLGTSGARQLRDRAPAGMAEMIRARVYFERTEDRHDWWRANRGDANALRLKASELGGAGNAEICDLLLRLAELQDSAGPPPQQQAEARAFAAFYRQELVPLTKLLCMDSGAPWELGKKLIRQAMRQAFDDWERLATSSDPGEWVLGFALLRFQELTPEERAVYSDPDAGPVTEALVADVALGSVPADWDADRAVTALYTTHYRSLVRLAALLVRDIATAEEVVQDSFVAMHGGWRRLRDSEKALSYLRQSVVNRSRSVLRHRVVVDRNAPKPPPDMPSAEHGAIALLERSAVVAALRTLPPRQREALVLRYYGDLSEAQIAAAMGISKGAVKSHTARAMIALRSVLEREA
jgi:RNA polymerase sigma-70 factor (sigma-E family)